MRKIQLLSFSSLFVFCTGCSWLSPSTRPTAPGRAAVNNTVETVTWRFDAPPVCPVWPGTGPSRPSEVTVRVERHEASVTQPESPQAPAVIDMGAGKVTIPASYAPGTGDPAPPTPAAKAVGYLVWLGGGLVVLGMLGVALRFLPWTAAVGAVVPIGLSVGVALAGLFLIAFSLWLSAAPMWLIGVCVGVVVLVAVLVATRDNWKKLFDKEN